MYKKVNIYQWYVQAEYDYVTRESVTTLLNTILPGFLIFEVKDSEYKTCFIIQYVTPTINADTVNLVSSALRCFAKQECVMTTVFQGATECTCKTADSETPAQRAEWLLSKRFPATHQGV